MAAEGSSFNITLTLVVYAHLLLIAVTGGSHDYAFWPGFSGFFI